MRMVWIRLKEIDQNVRFDFGVSFNNIDSEHISEFVLCTSHDLLEGATEVFENVFIDVWKMNDL